MVEAQRIFGIRLKINPNCGIGRRGATWSNWIRDPTVVFDASKTPSTARQDASSQSATSLGVASTGTEPDLMAIAVSASETTSEAFPHRPGSKFTPVRYERPVRGGQSVSSLAP